MQFLNKSPVRYNRLFSRVILCCAVFLFLFSLVFSQVSKGQTASAVQMIETSESFFNTTSLSTSWSQSTYFNYSSSAEKKDVTLVCTALDDNGYVRVAVDYEEMVYCRVERLYSNAYNSAQDRVLGRVTLEYCFYKDIDPRGSVVHRCYKPNTKAKIQKFNSDYNLDYVDIYLFHTKVGERINDNKEEIPVDFELGQNYDICRFYNTGEPCETGSDKPYYKTRTLNIKKTTLADAESSDRCRDLFCGTSSIWDYGSFLLGGFVLFYLSITSFLIGIIYAISIGINKPSKRWSKYVLLLLSVLTVIISIAIIFLAQLYNNSIEY